MSQILDMRLDPERLRDCAAWDEADRIADLELFGRQPLTAGEPIETLGDLTADTLGDVMRVPSAMAEAAAATELRLGAWLSIAGAFLAGLGGWVLRGGVPS